MTLLVDEAAHLTRVLRLQEGHAVRAFDGRGLEFDAVVERSARAGVRLRLGAARVPAPEREVAVTIAQAVLKGDKMDAVVRDAAMIGVAAIQPFTCSRSETTIAALGRGHRRDRWERIAIASVKQCGRAVVPRILQPCTLAALTQTFEDNVAGRQAFTLVEPLTPAGVGSLAEVPLHPPPAATIVVGPEGGWTSDEIASLSSVCRLVTLRGPTLRADAASIVAVTALYARWGVL